MEARWTDSDYIEFVLTLYNILSPPHDVDDTARILWSGQSLATKCTGAQEAEGNIQQLTPTPENNTQGFEEHMQNRNEVTQRCSQIYVSPT